MPPRRFGQVAQAGADRNAAQVGRAGGEYKQHWAFVAPQRPAVPAVKNRAWVRNPIDAFVLARLEREGLEPSPPADAQHAAAPAVARSRSACRRRSTKSTRSTPTSGDDAYDAAGRAAARLAPLRRTLGPHLARRGPLRRLRWLRKRQAAVRLDVSRLGHRRVQPRPAVRPVRHRADRRRPAAERRRRISSWPPASCATR